MIQKKSKHKPFLIYHTTYPLASSILGAVSAYISIQTQPIRVRARGACALPRSLANPPLIPHTPSQVSKPVREIVAWDSDYYQSGDTHLLLVDELVWQVTRTLARECECVILFGLYLGIQKSPNTMDQWIESD